LFVWLRYHVRFLNTKGRETFVINFKRINQKKSYRVGPRVTLLQNFCFGSLIHSGDNLGEGRGSSNFGKMQCFFGHNLKRVHYFGFYCIWISKFFVNLPRRSFIIPLYPPSLHYVHLSFGFINKRKIHISYFIKQLF